MVLLWKFDHLTIPLVKMHGSTKGIDGIPPVEQEIPIPYLSFQESAASTSASNAAHAVCIAIAVHFDVKAISRHPIADNVIL